jgi:hypothetical protein
MSVFHEGLGLLAQAGYFPSRYQNLLVAKLSPSSRFEPKTVNYQGETIINSTSDRAVVALGRAAVLGELPGNVLSRLGNTVAARPALVDREVVVRGLSVRRYAHAENLGRAILQRLRLTRMDATARLLEEELIATRLAALPHSEREALTSELIAAWQVESEPEIKIAIATAIGFIPVKKQTVETQFTCSRR